MIRVVVADSHPTMRLGVRTLLGRADDVRIVGETGDSKELFRLVGGTRPDLVVLSLNIGGQRDGVEAFRAMKVLPEAPRVLIHSAYNFCTDVSSCLLAGADGYLHKSVCCEELLDIIRRVAGGERVWIVNGGAGDTGILTSRRPGGTRLTGKEREVASFMLRHYSNLETAETLHLSLPTVKTHVRNILRKLNAKNRAELFLRYLPEAPLSRSTSHSREDAHRGL